MSDNQELHVGEKLQALWDKFAHDDNEGRSVAIDLKANSEIARSFFIRVTNNKEKGCFDVSFSSEYDGTHIPYFDGTGNHNIGASFNSETGLYVEETASIVAKLGGVKKDSIILGVHDEKGARQIGMALENYIDIAYQAHCA